ncbi:MAG: outer membrane lipoprotein carrier protein LolA [Pseudomonadota bacterium]|nr:outer membrane lipoprotein carrier protein LolA [Pseudomonadota bacterium]
MKRLSIAALAASLLTVFMSAVGAAPPFDVEALTRLLRATPPGEATFTESRRVEMLDRTLESSGRLSFKAPDSFVRETLKPRHEKLAVAGNQVTMSRGEQSRTVQLDAVPEAAVLVEAIRGTLSGNREALERLFTIELQGNAGQWSLELTPRDARLRRQVSTITVGGREGTVREVRLLLADGDRTLMKIEPMTPAGK